jgi:GT2 family glycosyltransferase
MWCTENKQKYNKKIAYVICTYKREEYVKKNVEIFSKFIIDNPDLAEFFHLYIIDNGKTLDIESNTNKYISVFHNLNSGGAGGFTRGIIEVMKSKEKDYDNIILMDDDGLLFPESLKRTLCLINYLKEQYKSFFINGVFLNLYDTNSLLGQFSVQNQENMRPKNLYGQLDLSEYSNILQISEPLDVDYIRKVYNNITCTWGYCCFPVNIIETNGLPLPLFIYGDDVEFSWRNKKANIIMLNGIAFWHRPVSFARNTINYRFFAQRNIIILNILYGRNFHIKIKKFLKSYFFDLLRTYDYIGIKLFLHALDDILRGDSMFDDDPENKLIKIYNIYNSYKLKITPYKFKSEFATPKLSKKQNLILSKLYKYSFYGLLVPNFLFKNVSISFGGNFNINCMFSKRILAINPVERTVQHRFFDRKLHIYYTYLFYRKLYAITKIYNKLRSEFINARKRTSTLIFWKNYLKLNNDEAQ